jgi:hypothetical protein
MLALVTLGAGCVGSSDVPGPGLQEATPPIGSVSIALDLHGRGLEAIPANVFSRTDLERLDLSGNRLTGAPPSEIGKLKNLVSLDLSKNGLTGLPAELGQLRELEELIVSDNALTGLPLELGHLAKLRILDVSGNPYSTKDLDAISSKLPYTEIRR